MKSLKESLLDGEDELIKKLDKSIKITQSMEILKNILNRLDGGYGYDSYVRYKHKKYVDACDRKLNVGDLVLISNHSGGYSSMDYFLVGVVVGFINDRNEYKVKINTDGNYDQNKPIETSYNNTYLCSQVLKLPSQTIKNLYK